MKRLWYLLTIALMLPLMLIMGIIPKKEGESSSLSDEEKTEIANLVAEGLKASGLLDPERKFVPGEGGEKEPAIVIGDSPEDKIMADRKGGFRDHGEFIVAITGKGTKYYGTTHLDKLKAWNNAVMKIAGTVNEGDMSQGGSLVPVEFRDQLLMTAL